MKVLSIICLILGLMVSSHVVASTTNLPFVGKKEFYFEGYDSQHTMRHISIDKQGNTKIFFETDKAEMVYQEKYKKTMCRSDKSECFRIFDNKTIALTDTKGKVLTECGFDGVSRCSTSLENYSGVE